MELLTLIRSRATVASASAVALALAPLAGCELMREPTPLGAVDQMIAVHAMLVAGDDTAAVLVTRSLDPGTFPPAEPLPGATARLVGAGQSIALLPGADACTRAPPHAGGSSFASGCYSGAVPGGIVAGTRYELEVTLPGGGTVTGATTVPAPPALLGPVPGTEIEVRTAPAGLPEPFVVRWSSAAAPRRAEIALRADRPGCIVTLRVRTSLASTPYTEVTGADSAVLRTGYVECGGQVSGPLDAHVVLTAYEANYADYAERVVDVNAVASARVAAGVQGAAGVFGSAAAASVPVVLVRR